MFCYAKSRLILGLAIVLLFPTEVYSTTFNVNSYVDEVDADTGDGVCKTLNNRCTLRAAIQQSNALAGKDVVDIPAGTYLITIPPVTESINADSNGDFDITDEVEIRGAGKEYTVIDGNHLSGVFTIDSDRIKFKQPLLQNYGHHLLKFKLIGVAIRNAVGNGITINSNEQTNKVPNPITSKIDSFISIRTLSVDLQSTSISSSNAVATISNSGYGIYASGFVELSVTDSEITDNESGGVYSAIEALSIVTTKVLRNKSVGISSHHRQGGGYHEFGTIYPVRYEYEIASRVRIANSVVSQNLNGVEHRVVGRNINGGGGIALFDIGSVFIENTVISENSSGIGGGVYAWGCSVYIADSIIEKNVSRDVGGGIFSNSGELVIVNSRVNNNSATQGGGIYSSYNHFIENVDLYDNAATENGGGIYFGFDTNFASYYGYKLGHRENEIRNSRIVNNRATAISGNGGGLFFGGQTSLTLVNNTFSNNSAENGDNLYHFDGMLDILNSTLVSSAASSSNISVRNISRLALAKITNSILVSGLNRLNCIGVPLSGGGNISNDNSCSFSEQSDKNNTDPLIDYFEDVSRIYRLQTNSPAINNAVATYCPATDQYYTWRGSLCDIGATEFDGGPYEAGVVKWKTQTYKAPEGTEIELVAQRVNGSEGKRTAWVITSFPNSNSDIDNLNRIDRLVWLSGDSSDKTIKFKIVDDKLRENDELHYVFLVDYEGGDAARVVDTMAIDIPGSDPLVGNVWWLGAPYNSESSIFENKNYFDIPIKRINGFEGKMSVRFETVDDGAKAGTDYESTSGTLEWDDGETDTKRIRVNIFDNLKYEKTKRLKLRLFDATDISGFARPPWEAMLEIKNDDPWPNEIGISRQKLQFSESDTNASVTIYREGMWIDGVKGLSPLNAPLTIQVRKTADSAKLGEDFTDALTSVTFEPNISAVNIPLGILDDSVFEPNETFTLTLIEPTGNNSFNGGNAITITIIDDDSSSQNNGSTSTTQRNETDTTQVLEPQPDATPDVKKKHWYSSVDIHLLTLLLLLGVVKILSGTRPSREHHIQLRHIT